MSNDPPIRLCGLLVHWHDEDGAARVAAEWGDDPRFRLLVIDNGATRELSSLETGDLLRPGRNLGFAGAVNLGLSHTEAPLVLMLNTDCCPQPGALEELLKGFARHPEAAGLAPQLVGPDGRSQHQWQLRPLPTLGQLMLQALMLPLWSGPSVAPAAGAPVEQPAAAALAIRRQVLVDLGGLDERFHPAWFEDVDLAARLKSAGEVLVYWPDSRFNHGLGRSVDTLGYGRFLWLHYRNLYRFLVKHHGRFWAEAARLSLVPVSLFRLILLPLRRPKRASSRQEAAMGLWNLVRGALSRWKYPERFLEEPQPTSPERGYSS